jgi:hypothetical protein
VTRPQPARADWIAQFKRRGALWIVPEFKVLFVSVAKNACTSIKWVLAELAREEPSKFKAGLNPFTSDRAAVHDRRLHLNIPMPGELDARVRSEIHPDNGWFIFGVIRDPRSRLFSAWQDKVLLAYPGSSYRVWSTESWYPARPGEDAETINRQFAEFVDAAVADAPFAPRRNTHFRAQTDSLDTGRIPFTAIYPIEKLGQLRDDLARHVAALGWTEPITFRRDNETPLPANAAVFAGEVKAKVEQWYASDFAEFGEHFDFSRIEAAPEWTPAQLREVQVRAALHRRLGDVRELALEYRQRADENAKRPGRVAPTTTVDTGSATKAATTERFAPALRRRLRRTW